MRVLLVAMGVASIALVIAGVSSATHDYSGSANSVQEIASGGPGGNYLCPADTIVGPKLDPGSNYSDQYLTVSGYDGKSFDWALTDPAGINRYDMALVIVKGGPISAVYTYDYASVPGTDNSDNNLTAATNPNNGKDYGISHIQFCYDPKGGGNN